MLASAILDSPSPASSSPHGSTTTPTSTPCCAEIPSTCRSNPHFADLCTPPTPPLKLQHADICQLSPPFSLPPRIKVPVASTTLAAPVKFAPRRVERDSGAMKKSMGLMKLRRQGSHPPASNQSCHGSFNQAAAARELMAGLERLSMKEKAWGEIDAKRVKNEAQKALLAGEGEQKSVSGATGRRNHGLKLAELPLTAKIAAAMDAEGLIGVQEEITMQCEKYKIRALRSALSDQCSLHSANSCKASRSRSCKPHSAGAAAASGDDTLRSVAVRKKLCRRRSRWIILRRLRSSRALLGKLWTKLKRVFLSSSRRSFQK